ncbi:MAG: HAMP domain-containing histidine kinase [Clostridiales bacterium]|nr:HAMP domain-containing histidine kinase [Clostridiales bacterium]
MSRFRKTVILILCVEILLIILSNVFMIFFSKNRGDLSKVEAKRVARRVSEEPVENIDLSEYPSVIRLVRFNEGDVVNNDYIIAFKGDDVYRIEYRTESSIRTLLILDSCLIVMFAVTIIIFIYIDRKILKPFNNMTAMTVDLAKGNLTTPIKQDKSKFFGKFIWGMDMLRENLEDSKKKELEYQKEKKTLVLSLSHDIKTPLSAIELYTKALKEGLYDTEEKRKEALEGILKNTDEIKRYAGEISKISREDFMDLSVNIGEVYLDDVMNKISAYYHDKLSVLHTEFTIEEHSNCLLCCDADRLVEVLQNFMENAIKYGDGRSIKISFSEEEDHKLISVENSGVAPDETDMQNIFDSFYRGKNTKDINGSGLGLYICKHLMHKMDGDVYAEAKDDGFNVVAVVKMA